MAHLLHAPARSLPAAQVSSPAMPVSPQHSTSSEDVEMQEEEEGEEEAASESEEEGAAPPGSRIRLRAGGAAEQLVLAALAGSFGRCWAPATPAIPCNLPPACLLPAAGAGGYQSAGTRHLKGWTHFRAAEAEVPDMLVEEEE